MYFILTAVFILAISSIYFLLDCDLLLSVYNLIFPNLNFYKKKVVWVTGASTGIGRATAIKLAEQGAFLVLSATNQVKLDQTKQECLEISKGQLEEKDVMVAAFDLADIEKRTIHYEAIQNRFGRLDVLINNAGILGFSRVTDQCFEDIERQTQINYLANVHLALMVSRDWVRNRQKGRIVVTSSMAAYFGFPLSSAYSATKSAVNAFYNVMRMELFHRNIPITVVCPGAVCTELFRRPISSDGSTINLSCWDSVFGAMTAERCARLLLVAGANRFAEVLVAKQPQLLGITLAQLTDNWLQYLLKWCYTKSVADFVQRRLINSKI